MLKSRIFTGTCCRSCWGSKNTGQNLSVLVPLVVSKPCKEHKGALGQANSFSLYFFNVTNHADKTTKTKRREDKSNLVLLNFYLCILSTLCGWNFLSSTLFPPRLLCPSTAVTLVPVDDLTYV